MKDEDKDVLQRHSFNFLCQRELTVPVGSIESAANQTAEEQTLYN